MPFNKFVVDYSLWPHQNPLKRGLVRLSEPLTQSYRHNGLFHNYILDQSSTRLSMFTRYPVSYELVPHNSMGKALWIIRYNKKCCVKCNGDINLDIGYASD